MRKDKFTPYGDGELQVGESTWNKAERSARVFHRNRIGGFNPKSPEVPMDALFHLFMFALLNGEFQRDHLIQLRNVIDDLI